MPVPPRQVVIHAPATADGRGWKRYTGRGLLLLVSVLSLYLLLPSLVAVFSSWRSLSRLNWYWAAIALVFEAASFVSLWNLDRIALRTKKWFAVATAQLSGNAVGRVVPGGGATATAFSVDMLRRAGIPVSRAATALAASTALQLATTFALPLLAIPAILGGAPVNKSLITAVYLGAAVLVMLLAAGAAAFLANRPIEVAGQGIQWAINHTIRRRRHIAGLRQKLLAERDVIRTTIGQSWVGSVLSAVGNIGFDYLALLCALRAVGTEPRPSLVLIAYASAALLALIPLTPGGLGFVEAGLVGTLTLAGVAPKEALLATLVYRLVSFWIPIPAGGVAYGLAQRARRGQQADPNAALS
jgi:uncharacterized protein (TIRG00374 family)